MFRWVLYPIGKTFLFFFLLLFGPVKVRGRGNVPRSGGLLVAANHRSDCDPAVVGHALPRPTYFMAKEELFRVPVLGPIIRAFRAFPVKRGTPDRAAIRSAVELLKRGECVVMFPEGQLSEDGNLQPILPGALLIARMAAVPVVCCGLRGTERIIPFGKVLPRPALGGVSASFGEPRTLTGVGESDALGWIAAEFLRLSGQSEEHRRTQDAVK